MKRFRVRLTVDARRDLPELHGYLAAHESAARAGEVLDRLGEVLESLCVNPGRGSVPQELRNLGGTSIRQIVHDPYRIIYRLDERQVFVFLIADGRRDMQSLLAQRLLRLK